MVTRSADPDEDGVLFLVVNAATKEADYAHLAARLPAGVRLIRADHRALIALQGPMARPRSARHCPEAVPMPFMSAITTRFDGIDCHISRSGYTGEDGYEISCKATRVRAIVERLLSEPSVKLIGLGARDSLRLEAGLCLYGHDIDTTHVAGRGGAHLVDPEAAARGGRLSRRRAHAARDCATGLRAARRHQAGRPRAGARGHRDHARPTGAPIGKVTSGGFGPSVNGPIAMGYVERGVRRARHASAADRARQGAAARRSSRCRSCRTSLRMSREPNSTGEH